MQRGGGGGGEEVPLLPSPSLSIHPAGSSSDRGRRRKDGGQGGSAWTSGLPRSPRVSLPLPALDPCTAGRPGPAFPMRGRGERGGPETSEDQAPCPAEEEPLSWNSNPQLVSPALGGPLKGGGEQRSPGGMGRGWSRCPPGRVRMGVEERLPRSPGSWFVPSLGCVPPPPGTCLTLDRLQGRLDLCPGGGRTRSSSMGS